MRGMIFDHIEGQPYKHCYSGDVFEPELYEQLLANRPEPDDLRQIGTLRGSAMKKYPERFCFLIADNFSLGKLPETKRKFWRSFTDELCDGKFAREALEAFGIERTVPLGNEIYLVRDITKYALGPHTDTPSKVLSIVFYLADDHSRPELGTSVYAPNDWSYSDPTGKHHDRSEFQLIRTMPYAPNSMFAFARTDTSFHGVEPVTGERWLLLYDIHKK